MGGLCTLCRCPKDSRVKLSSNPEDGYRVLHVASTTFSIGLIEYHHVALQLILHLLIDICFVMQLQTAYMDFGGFDAT